MDIYKYKRYIDIYIKYNKFIFEGMFQEFCVFCCEIIKFVYVCFFYG